MRSPLAPNDLFSIVTVADPRLAPDGSVYFRRSQADRAADATLSAIWRVDPGGTSAPFTAGRNDRLPRIAPDGSLLAFVGERADKPRIYLMPTAGGEARAIGDAYDKIVALEWSPDGARLAFVASTEHEPRTARVFHDTPSGARHIRALPFKSDLDGLLDGTRRHVFVLDVRSGACERMTWGDFDAGAPAWARDGTRIAFSAAIGLPECSFAADIHVVDCASKTVRTLTGGDGPMESPAWSHDGATIAFLGHQHGDDAGGRFNTELLLVDVASGRIASLSAGLDRTVGNAIINDLRSGLANAPPVWSADDREIFTLVSDEGACGIRAFARDGGASRIVAAGERDIFAFAHDAGTFAFAFSTPQIPADVARIAPDGSETRLTALNAAWLADKLVVTPQRYRPAADDGTRLDAWLLVPLAAPEPQPLVQRILDGALARGGLDRSRVGIAGGSYGGFMTTWLLGHSDRFAAGVSMRAVNDFVSEVGASDIGWFLERELRTPPNLGDRGQALFDASPMRAVPQIDAPLLVEHSERDYRCPIDQGEQLFTLLRRLGKKKVEFVRFTGDGHELSRGGKPRNRILRLRAIAHWFIRHLRPAGIAPAPDEAGALFAPLPYEDEPKPPVADS